MSTEQSAVTAVSVFQSAYPVYIHYFSQAKGGVTIVSRYPTKGCLVVKTTLGKEVFEDTTYFRNDSAVWRFAKKVGKPYEEA
jgi:hypothetical protein